MSEGKSAPYGDLPPLSKEERDWLQGWLPDNYDPDVALSTALRALADLARVYALLDALTAVDPVIPESSEWAERCVYCGPFLPHAPDCPWLRAKERR